MTSAAAALLLLLLSLALAAGCTSTTTTTVSVGGSESVSDNRRNPNDPADAERRARVRLELAGAYFGSGQAQTALDEIKVALAARPDMPEALSLRGLIYASLGQTQAAEDSLKRALQVAPRDADTMHNYGWFLCQQRRYVDADAQFAAALAQPQYREVQRTLLARGVCQARGGAWADAERTLTRSLELDPANPTVGYNLSDVLYRRGDYERARFYIARVNALRDASNAQTLWLAARIERRLGNAGATEALTRQLRQRFPQSAETLASEQGRFDE